MVVAVNVFVNVVVVVGVVVVVEKLNMYIYIDIYIIIYIYIYVYLSVYLYIYIYIYIRTAFQNTVIMQNHAIPGLWTGVPKSRVRMITVMRHRIGSAFLNPVTSRATKQVCCFMLFYVVSVCCLFSAAQTFRKI